MKIIQTYSHLNGLEYLKVHKNHLLTEIEQVIAAVDAGLCQTKESKEKRKIGKGMLYSPKDMNKAFEREFKAHHWSSTKVDYWVTGTESLIRATMALDPEDQRQAIIDAGEKPLKSYNQTDFVKERVAVEVQFGKYAFVAHDLFVKHMAFYVGDTIDIGVEILPMKSLQEKMSSGVPYYEGAIYNVVRQGRGVPAVPLVIYGIAPDDPAVPGPALQTDEENLTEELAEEIGRAIAEQADLQLDTDDA